MMQESRVTAEEQKSETALMVENYYKRIMRILEYYVLVCFILVTFVPLLNYEWIPGLVKIVYFTGFPLLVLIFLISLFKDPILDMITKILEK